MTFIHPSDAITKEQKNVVFLFENFSNGKKGLVLENAHCPFEKLHRSTIATRESENRKDIFVITISWCPRIKKKSLEKF